MILKPHKLFYFLPFLLLVIAGVIGIIFIIQAMFVANLEPLQLDEWIEIEMNEGDFVSLYIDDQDIEDVSFYMDDNFYVYTVTLTDETHYQLYVSIEGIDNDLNPIDVTVTRFTVEDDYRVNNALNFLDIECFTSGTYTFSITSVDEVTGTLGFAVSDVETFVAAFGKAVSIWFFAFLVSILTFFVIFFKRSNYKKNHMTYNDSNQNYQYDEDFQPIRTNYDEPKKKKKSEYRDF